MGYRRHEWGYIAERFIEYQIEHERILWSKDGWKNLQIYLTNSRVATLTSMRLASRLNNLTRNERLNVVVARISLSAIFGCLIFQYRLGLPQVRR